MEHVCLVVVQEAKPLRGWPRLVCWKISWCIWRGSYTWTRFLLPKLYSSGLVFPASLLYSVPSSPMLILAVFALLFSIPLHYFWYYTPEILHHATSKSWHWAGVSLQTKPNSVSWYWAWAFCQSRPVELSPATFLSVLWPVWPEHRWRKERNQELLNSIGTTPHPQLSESCPRLLWFIFKIRSAGVWDLGYQLCSCVAQLCFFLFGARILCSCKATR